MKSLILISVLSLSMATMAQAQTDVTTGATPQTNPTSSQRQENATFQGHFRNKEIDIDMMLNLYEKNVKVPGYEDEPCYGFVRGKINGIWMVMKVKSIDEKQAVVRVTSEIGADAVDVRFKVLDNGALTFEHVGEIGVKAVQGSKYVKLPKVVTFEKVK